MGEMRSKIRETIAGSEWSGEVKTRCSCLEIPERRRGRGVTRDGRCKAAREGRKLDSGKEIGASLDAVVRSTAQQLFEGKRRRGPDWRRDREGRW